MQLVECVPNFSEGRNHRTIDAIASAIADVADVHLLDIDSNASANRTVITFVGEARSASKAAFAAIKTAQLLIDMEKHHGEHPRIGATDVCPFVPLSGCTMDECVVLSVELAERVGRELKIPVYLYAQSARAANRRRLAAIRKGQYEALGQRMKEGFVPDCGPASFNAKSGATVIGARDLLIAFNLNLDSKSKEIAQDIASQIRQARRFNDFHNEMSLKPHIAASSSGTVLQTEALTDCTAIGWFIEEFERAQISMNLLDYKKTSLWRAFLEVSQVADLHGCKVTGSEIVGLVPLQAMLETGKFQRQRTNLADGGGESRLIDAAVQFLNLRELKAFDPSCKILDYRLQQLSLPLNI